MPELVPQIDSVESISVWSDASIGPNLVGFTPATLAWPSANLAIFVPFRVSRITRITNIVVACGSTSSNNFDTGIYDRYGNRLISSGSVARVSGSEIIANITDITLGPGVYYMALSSDSTGAFMAFAPNSAGVCKAFGMKQMASAFPLPNPATFATAANAYIPSFALNKVPS